MSEYELVNDQFKDKWINKPNNMGDVGDLQDITEELNNLLRERDELAALLAAEKSTRNSIIEKGVKTERERDEAIRQRNETNESSKYAVDYAIRERDEAKDQIKNLKLQLELWEDGNIICEETLGEIRLLKEQIDRVLLERNEAHKIAERAIDDLAWFSETNAQRLRAELDQLKGSTCPVCTPEQKCWECADDVSQEGAK
jgi:DNA repair exonuclease SbcCD ATPase subunit